jgi:hypothetical protein
MLVYTPVSMELAEIYSKNQDLSAFFRQKNKEEDGHIEWAFDDLANLGKKKRKVDIDDTVAPSASLLALNLIKTTP